MEPGHTGPSPFAPGARFALAVEADPAGRAALGAALGRAGYVVITAADGRDAVETAPMFPFSVIVLRRDPPDMGRDETVRRIRALGGAMADIPILHHLPDAPP